MCIRDSSWTAPSGNGSAILDYSILIKKEDGNWDNASSGRTNTGYVTDLKSTIQVTVLTSHLNLAVGDKVEAKIIATNGVGPSLKSNVGMGAIIPCL